MPSRPESFRLEHIRDNIRLIQTWTGTMTFEAFQAKWETVYAVIRALEVISEASRHLSEPTKERLARLPWRDIADAGNF